MKKNKPAILIACLAVVLLVIGGIVLFMGKDKEGNAPKEKAKPVSSNFPAMAENGYVVYFNPETGKVGTEADYNANTGASDTGNKSGFMKWYVFNDDGGKTVNLLLDHNTTAWTAWNSDYGISEPDALNKQLAKDVAGWTSTIRASARIITAYEVAQSAGIMDFDPLIRNGEFLDEPSSYDFGVEYGTNPNSNPYAWLYDRTGDEALLSGAFNNSTGEKTEGYWTSTPNAENEAWGVLDIGCMSTRYMEGFVNYGDKAYYGVRPVISILRINL